MTLAIPDGASATATERPTVITPRRAYLELLLIYAVMFGPVAVLSIADFLTSCGLLPASAHDQVYRWDLPLCDRVAVAGWCGHVLVPPRPPP